MNSDQVSRQERDANESHASRLRAIRGLTQRGDTRFEGLVLTTKGGFERRVRKVETSLRKFVKPKGGECEGESGARPN